MNLLDFSHIQRPILFKMPALIFILMVMTSCVKTEAFRISEESYVDVHIYVMGDKVPNTRSAEPSDGNVDSNIDYINILCFDYNNDFVSSNTIYKDKIQETLSPNGSGGREITFTIKAKQSDLSYTYVMIANSNITKQLKSFSAGDDKNTVLSSLYTEEKYNGSFSSLPMWGEVTLNSVSSDGTSNPIQPTGTLLRAVARFDVRIAASVTNFKLYGASVWLSPDKGLTVPTASTLIISNSHAGNVNAPTMPSTYNGLMSNSNVPSYSLTSAEKTSGTKDITNKIFSHENHNYDQAGEIQSGDKRRTRLVVWGEYTDGDGVTEVRYYRVDIKDYVSDTYYDILRNHIYSVEIPGFVTSGEGTEEEAAVGKSIEGIVHVNPWIDMDNVFLPI